jgi:predicted amidohydrolase YtcJ
MDLILYNANIHTQYAKQPKATALAIRDGRIRHVGGDDIRALGGSMTEMRDMAGQTILPGLCDAHIHMMWSALSLLEINVADLPSKSEAVTRVGQAVAKTPPDGWLIGRGWAQDLWTERAFPTAADLDAVSGGRPAYLRARSAHAAWVNSAALAIAGITDSTPDPQGGQIQRDEQGKATGILFEAAMGLVADIIPVPSAAQTAQMLTQLQNVMWAAGLTAAHDYDGPSAFYALQLLHDSGVLGLRVVKNINDPYIDHAIKLGMRWGFGDDWLRTGGLKIFADGALGSLTAAMIDPYEGTTDKRGIVVTSKQTMRDLVLRATEVGFPSTIHAIGDQAVRDVLDVYAAARELESRLRIPRSARRHRIEHVQIIHPHDADRLASLGIIASMQPIHATSDYPTADRHWGARCALAYNARHQIDKGVVVAFGSDSPVEPLNPFKGIHAAVTRRRGDGSPGPEGWYPAQRLTVAEALRGYTIGPAYAAGMEDRLGQLAPGYHADLIVVDRDPFTIDPHDLLHVQVRANMSGGQWRIPPG